MRSPTQSTVFRAIACDRASKSSIVIRYSCLISAKAIGGVEEAFDIEPNRILERREAAVIARSPQPIDLCLREILVAAANRFGHVDILDIRLGAEGTVGRH